MFSLFALALALAAEPNWDTTLDVVTHAVVAIKMDVPRAFDGNNASNSQATGFVIEEGWILTNRHVVTPGPVKSKAVFFDKEEVDLVPVYRDPVHDFGLYRYDPADLKHMQPPSLPLSPDHARVGLDIRVVGNDGGDQLQILDGTLARLDRAAPAYGSSFNDFNTFYYQAASATSGGSSGSPVVDVEGHVVAINAGGSGKTASSYYLPLNRVVRAVELLKAGEAVTRGTLQTRVELEPFNELERLGISAEVLDDARKRRPESTGLLVVKDVLPLGPAFRALIVGDVVLSVNGTPIHDHLTLEGTLDASVGKSLTLEVARRGEQVSVDVTPQDLHAITPHAFLELGDAVVHPLSYHQARVMQAPVMGLSVAEPGYMFGQGGVPDNAIIVEVDGKTVSTLQAFDTQLAAIGHGQNFQVRYFKRGRPRESYLRSVRMDRVWFEQRLCTRDDATGTWPCVKSEVNLTEVVPPIIDVELPPADDKWVKKLQNSLVRLEVSVPVMVGGIPSSSYGGTGLLVGDGLVLTDRDTVPVALVDVEVVVGGVTRLPARVVALHPVHNVAVLQFDPAAVAAAGLVPATLRAPFEKGDDVHFVGLNSKGAVSSKASIEDIVPMWLPDGGTPRFREANLDVFKLDKDPEGTPGVLIDKKGHVGGFWASFSYTIKKDTKASWLAMPSSAAIEALELARGGTAARGVPFEVNTVPVSAALDRGLPVAEVEALVQAAPDRRLAVQIIRVMAGQTSVRPGDLLLSAGGKPVTRFADLDAAVRGKDAVRLRLFRDGKILTETVPTEVLLPVDIDRVVLWNGLRVHMAHRAVEMHGLESCPYVSFRDRGSPGARAGIYAWRCIEAVNGTPTPDLDALLAVDATLQDGDDVRVDIITLEGRRQVQTLEPERAFWPTVELGWDGSEWTRTVHSK